VNANNGSESTINVRNSPNLYGLIKFNLSSIPTSVTIESANISLYLNTTGDTQNVSFHRVQQDWNEDDITWGNWYSTSNYSSSSNILGKIESTSVDRYYDFSVFTDVKYFHNNIDKNYSWLIKVTETNLVQLDSKEAVNESRRPVLHVTYSE